MNKDFLFTTKAGNTLELSVYGDNPGAPVVIFVHGFKGFKDWGFGPYIGEYFAAAGFRTVTFNFSHNGIRGGSDIFNELEKFEKNSYSLEVSELTELIDSGLQEHLQRKTEPVFLAGHSRGGAVSIIAGMQNPSVSAISVWGSVSGIKRFTERQLETWKSNGYLEVLNTRTGQRLRMGTDLLNDVLNNVAGSLNIPHILAESVKPLLIVHGEQDLTVRKTEAEELHRNSVNGNSQLIILPRTGHTFGVVHPFAGSTPEFDTVLAESTRFFKSFL